MTRWMIVAGLLLLNAVLGAGVYQQLMERKAQAQARAGMQPEVAAVAGISNGQTVIYMLDVVSGRLVAQRVDVTNARVEVIGRRDVAQDMARVGP
jgi:hypothetical protein